MTKYNTDFFSDIKIGQLIRIFRNTPLSYIPTFFFLSIVQLSQEWQNILVILNIKIGQLIRVFRNTP